MAYKIMGGPTEIPSASRQKTGTIFGSADSQTTKLTKKATKKRYKRLNRSIKTRGVSTE